MIELLFSGVSNIADQGFFHDLVPHGDVTVEPKLSVDGQKESGRDLEERTWES